MTKLTSADIFNPGGINVKVISFSPCSTSIPIKLSNTFNTSTSFPFSVA